MAMPVKGATVTVSDTGGHILGTSVTDESGNSSLFALDAPPVENTQDPGFGTDAYSVQNVKITAPGFYPVQVNGVQTVNDASLLPVTMHPLPTGRTVNNSSIEVIDITPPAVALPTPPQLQERDGVPSDTRDTRLAGPVCLPDYVRVHLGVPTDSGAATVRVAFIDYIKNVVSSEIYSTWNTGAIIANIHAIVTFILNRVYTEWYPSRGYSFDITNSTSYDQKYIHGRNIFKNISNLVDQYFNTFARRIGFANPYFTEYCNGTTATCRGMSQWGTESLAQQGYNPLQILHYYYPDDLQLVQTSCRNGVATSYPGSELRLGSTGANVQRIQNFLNRIRTDYPAIPQITNPDGYYGSDTDAAVRKFQQVFHLTPDGVVGPATWNKITQIYTGITKLSELEGEGERVGLSPTPPTSTISQGARGEDVAHLQYILDVLGGYYDNIPNVIRDSSYGTSTKNAVIAFQKMAGINPDGVVGPATWAALYSAYLGVIDTAPIPPNTGIPGTPTLPAYPGTLIREGSRGENVRTVQTYLNALHSEYPNIPAVSVDGVFGPATRAAVVAAQQQLGLTADGIVGPASWAEFTRQYQIIYGGAPPTAPGTPTTPSAPAYPGTPLREGSRGENVRVIQNYINTLHSAFPSIPAVSADGVFGPATRAAVSAAQRQFGLTQDGIVGPATWNEITRQALRLGTAPSPR
jgi:peptidoglycan hydrolase-like protein with peptidoglycan-binding domain